MQNIIVNIGKIRNLIVSASLLESSASSWDRFTIFLLVILRSFLKKIDYSSLESNFFQTWHIQLELEAKVLQQESSNKKTSRHPSLSALFLDRTSENLCTLSSKPALMSYWQQLMPRRRPFPKKKLNTNSSCLKMNSAEIVCGKNQNQDDQRRKESGTKFGEQHPLDDQNNFYLTHHFLK